jgi:NADH-quinone oxidoreductase subunit L
MSVLAWTALFSPAVAVVAIALLGERIDRRGAGLLAAGATFFSFVCTAALFFELLGREPEDRSILSTPWTWLTAGDLRIGASVLIDPLSVFMMLVVTGVGFLILVYAIGYMHGDEEERRYHAYKALFIFSMLLLVMGGNLLLLLAGWGMVGLSSYLLINYWHQRRAPVEAGKKAFIMNAFGDATFVLALFILVQQTGSLDFSVVFADAPEALGENSTLAVLVALGLLGGAVAKSAQVPLHTWLPDAMEGPTPVSALIHAATMVTAGVYLIVRTSPLFELAVDVQELAGILGAVTLLMAGLIALVQTDIKRVIAYSTMSQIGYMFVGAGLGAYGASMFHLLTHAFFKALLFMAAGLVIHALTGEQDIRKMGGLARELPWTYRAFLVGALALAAIPPFAGFFSKDSILSSLIDQGSLGWLLWGAGIVGAFLTGLYTFRLLFIVFFGEQTPYAREHLHKERFEGPLAMMWPVGVLAVLSIVAGFLQVPEQWHLVDDWLEPVVESVPEATGGLMVFSIVASLAAATGGIAVAWALYRRPGDRPAAIRARLPWAANALEHKLWWDEAYDAVFYRPASALANWLLGRFEGPIVLRSLGGLGTGVRDVSDRVAAVQTGRVRGYVLALAVGLAVLAIVFLVVA